MTTTIAVMIGNEQLLGAFGFYLNYDSEQIALDNTWGVNGIIFLNNDFPSMAAELIEPGKIYISGFDVEGIGSSEIIEFHWVALDKIGTGEFNFQIDNMTNIETGSMVSDVEVFCDSYEILESSE